MFLRDPNYSFGGHSGEGSVSASGLEPHPPTNAANNAVSDAARYAKK